MKNTHSVSLSQKIGDPVEFEMTYDRRTGKPIASTVSKIAPEVVLREERVIGTVTTEVSFGFFEQLIGDKCQIHWSKN